VGFVNNASDSPKNKHTIKAKFLSDLQAALCQDSDLKAFVFFTNIDLTPGEISKLESSALAHGVSFVNIYYRERIRVVLDSPEGLGYRYQYLGMLMSDAEQSSFFSRFGKDLEQLLTGRLERLERKIDLLEFARWQSGTIRRIDLRVLLKQLEESERREPEHFRVCMELQSVVYEKRSIILGGQDDYWESGNGNWYLGTKSFFFKQGVGTIEKSWIPQGPRVGGGYIHELHFGARWRPFSDTLAAEFDDLALDFHFTENLQERIARVRFTIDSYVFVDGPIRESVIDHTKPSLGWPTPLTEEQACVKWRACDFGWIRLDHLPMIKDR
jgi:hypothetical protein